MVNMVSGMDPARASASNDDDDDVGLYGGRSQANTKFCFTTYVFDIWSPCYGQLTSVKTRYSLAGIT